ncbi:MAG: phosphatidylglycerol lysyltransferase domain-containing protein [Treponema sp.]|nr:phosphatidylglycerol lysyltransferase domain-containing protein [Treponema sp.]
MTEQDRRSREGFLRQGFLPVDRNSYPLYKAHDENNRLSEMTAAIVTSWGSAFNAVYKQINGYLCSAWFTGGLPVYFEIHRPWGTGDCSLPEIVDVLYGLSREAGLPFLQIGVIDGLFLKEYTGIRGYHIKTGYDDDHSEYGFKTGDLLELSGGINEDKRRHLKKCSRIPDVSLRPMTKENVRFCLEIEEEWCRRQDCPVCGSLVGCEKKALEIMVDIFDDTVYNGVFAYIKDTPAGFAIGEKKDENISFLYFAKANVPDLNVYIYYMMVKTYLSGAEYLNLGEDMGKKGLRIFKTHLGVHEMWRKYVCTYTRA